MNDFDPRTTPTTVEQPRKHKGWRIAGIAAAGVTAGALAIGAVWAGTSLHNSGEPQAKVAPITSPEQQHKPRPDVKPKPIDDQTTKPSVSKLLPAEKSSDRIIMPQNSTNPGERLKAVDAKGKPVANAEIEFTVPPRSELNFGGKSSIRVKTDANGYATMPKLSAGSQTGDFNVVAKVVGKDGGATMIYKVTVQKAEQPKPKPEPEICPPGPEPEICPPGPVEPEVLPAA